jgi:hypothetical protein
MEQTQTPQKNLDDWRSDITPTTETLKIKDGESVSLAFADEGRKKESKDYGTSIAFQVVVIGEDKPKTFYVKANNFDLLSQIKQLGILTGCKVKISRTGSKKSDTRYKITKM